MVVISTSDLMLNMEFQTNVTVFVEIRKKKHPKFVTELHRKFVKFIKYIGVLLRS